PRLPVPYPQTHSPRTPTLSLHDALPIFEIAGVASASPGSKIEGLPFTTRYEDLLARPDVDAVINATPNYLHREITLAALAAGKQDRKSTRLKSSHDQESYAVFLMKKKIT